MSQTCDVCGREFARKGGLEKHKTNKVPCKAPTKLIQQALAAAGVPVEVSTGEFREASKKFNATTTKEQRAKEGIFFTPMKVRDLLFERLAETGVTPSVILEPSFGSGEFIYDARLLYPDAHILGVEKNADLFKAVSCNNSTLVCADFLSWTGRADLIIGNPPYFEMETGGFSAKEKREFAADNATCMTGRPNIYVKFLHKCLEQHLEPGGFLAFIIPTSIYNCSYYQPMRDYIQANTTIRCVESLDKPGFFETGQDTTLLILEKKKVSDDYIFRAKNGTVYITPFYKELAELTKDAQTIDGLGLSVKTGNVVWNQVKENLSDSGTLLIYASNIKNCELKINNLGGNEKKQYVKDMDKPTLDGPVILVERGYGNNFGFNSVLLTQKGFYAENHLNVIYSDKPNGLAKMNRVITSFKDPRSASFVKWFVGNGSISATELATIVPVF